MDVADHLAYAPYVASDVRGMLEAQGYPATEHEGVFRSLQAVGMLRRQRSLALREDVLYSPYVWGTEAVQIAEFLHRIPSNEREVLATVARRSAERPGSTVDDLGATPEVVVAARKVGLIDATRVVTSGGAERSFAFSPSLERQLAVGATDVTHERKQFVAHILYGHRFGFLGTGRIKNPIVLVSSLINQGRVGPATAIGTDYPLLEATGIVREPAHLEREWLDDDVRVRQDRRAPDPEGRRRDRPLGDLRPLRQHDERAEPRRDGHLHGLHLQPQRRSDRPDARVGLRPVTYTVDALARHRTQVVGGVTNTYAYAGSSQTVVQIANSTTTTNSAIDALGDRLATKTSAGGFGWLVPDLHGDMAAATNSAGTSITDAFRYDPYGKIVASATSSLPNPWRYQGRLLESSGSDPALYDFGFRSYDPGLGAFTSLDDTVGKALNPATFNRFLYADANPETLTDPTGHWPWDDVASAVSSVAGGIGDVGKNAIAFSKGVVEGAADTVVSTVTGTVALAGAAVGVTGCAMDSKCRNSAIASIGAAAQDFAHDPVGHAVQAGRDSFAAAKGAIGSAANTVITDWRAGNFEDFGKITGAIAATFVPVGGVLAKVGDAGRLVADAGRAADEAEVLGDAGKAAEAGGSLSERVTGRLDSCPTFNSFTPDTLVATPSGERPIVSLVVGDAVLAEDTSTGEVTAEPITVVHRNNDPITGSVVIAGEAIYTTPEHPFYTAEHGWVDAGALAVGEHVKSESSSYGLVSSVAFTTTREIMYNLTVDVDHTYFVGIGQWLVHNCGVGANRNLGLRGERAAGVDGPKVGVPSALTSGLTRYPDYLTRTAVGEIKTVAYQVFEFATPRLHCDRAALR